MKSAPPLPIKLDDDKSERVRRNHEQRLSDVENQPAVSMVTRTEIQLADGVTTPINHTLGKTPSLVIVSPPRGAVSTGRIAEIRDGKTDRSRTIQLVANGWGATITIDIGFVP
jgi:hypothetical protein